MKKPTMEELCRDINRYKSASESAEYYNQEVCGIEKSEGTFWEELENCTYLLEIQEQKIITNHYRELAGRLYRDLEAEKKKKENNG